jgi:hypothetical protein
MIKVLSTSLWDKVITRKAVKKKHNPCCGFQGLGQETPCQKLQQYGEGNINCYCLKYYNQFLQHQQRMEQPGSKNPANGHIIVSASSSIWQDELHLNQASAQPRSKNLINAKTDSNDFNGNVFNPSISIWHEESIGAQATTELDSSASVEPFPSPIGERLLHVASINSSPTTPIWDQATAQPAVQPSSTNQHHRDKPSNTISPQHGAPVENNDSDANFSSGIQQWELDNAAVTKQQLYLVENMHASLRIGAEVALAPVQWTELNRIVRLAVSKAVQ